MKKALLISLSGLLVLSSTLYAKNDKNDRDYDDNQYEKKYEKKYEHEKGSVKGKESNKKQKGYEKEKNVPHGIEKKTSRGGDLPKGWEKKVKKGQVLDSSIFKNAEEVKHSKYKDLKNTKIYRIEDKIFRVIANTREILEILN